ncbi:MAG: crossover junction endodeoxyribonuclease RuvC [Planctomycetota bacterium]
MRVLGIDPGLRLTGYGLVQTQTGAIEPTLIEAGVIKLDAKTPVAARLAQLAIDLNGLLDSLKPTRVAVEKLFAHYAHPRTAIVMGHARGVILLCAQQHGLAIEELGATEVKKSLTGNGHASKEQMQLAVQHQYGLAQPPSPPDVADAIAIATCCARRAAVAAL